MVFFEWTDELSVNIQEIDEQHKKLIQMLNDVYTAMSEKKGVEVLGDILNRMVDYADTHFSNEEKLMTQYAYEGLVAHKEQHAYFINKTNELKKQNEVNPTALSVETAFFLKDWLKNHIMVTGHQYAPFLNSKGVS